MNYKVSPPEAHNERLFKERKNMKIEHKKGGIIHVSIDIICPVERWDAMDGEEKADFIADDVNLQLAITNLEEEPIDA